MIEKNIKDILKKIQDSDFYDDFCELFGKAVYQKIHDDELTDFKFGQYILEALITDEADKVFGAFTGCRAESFLEKNLLIPNESKRYHDEICNARFVSVWDGGIEIETDCKVDTKNRLVFDIQESGINPDSIENLDEEYIVLDGIRMPVYRNDDVDEGDIFPFRYEV